MVKSKLSATRRRHVETYTLAAYDAEHPTKPWVDIMLENSLVFKLDNHALQGTTSTDARYPGNIMSIFIGIRHLIVSIDFIPYEYYPVGAIVSRE